ncbi:unnamed protein product [Pipistrellus nathusii]|uniref:BAR domain-containing protein n=1 Tax=Pipistrellus nathusii TaxID=59473 RepID=A0ABN9ZXZ0_PIPNA
MSWLSSVLRDTLWNQMLDQISVSEFIAQTTEDYNSPSTSSFTSRLHSCRNTVTLLEEALDQDRTALQKVKKSVTAICNSGQDHVQNEENYAQVLNKFGSNFLSGDNPELGTAFVQCSTLTKELSALRKTLLQELSHNVLFTLDSLVNGDLKGVKGDLKKPFDKAWKDYETKFTKIEKEKREHVQQHGMTRTEITGRRSQRLRRRSCASSSCRCVFPQSQQDQDQKGRGPDAESHQVLPRPVQFLSRWLENS